MLTKLDHIVVISDDLSQATRDYSALLGRKPDWTAGNEEDGTGIVLFQLGNTALELMGPQGVGPVGDKLKTMVAEGQGGLASLAFACDKIEVTHKKFMQRGLKPSVISDGITVDSETSKVRRWKRLRLDGKQTGGVRQFVLENDLETQLSFQNEGAGSVSELDHVVINSTNADRACALYGARLGCELRLDVERPDLASRFQFFRVGSATIEVVSRIGVDADLDANDELWGLSWAVDDVHLAHQRVKSAGFDVSNVRSGRKKGTQVFTVLNRTCNTPTLFIERPKR